MAALACRLEEEACTAIQNIDGNKGRQGLIDVDRSTTGLNTSESRPVSVAQSSEMENHAQAEERESALIPQKRQCL
jgi:hypothetical protein